MSFTYGVCQKCLKTNRISLEVSKKAICGSCQETLHIHGAVVESTDQTLEKLLAKSPLPVVIDIWAPWCGPCRSFAPTFESTSLKFSGRVVFTKVNSDQNPTSSIKLNVRGIPTICLYKNGQEIARLSGSLPQDAFERWLNEHL